MKKLSVILFIASMISWVVFFTFRVLAEGEVTTGETALFQNSLFTGLVGGGTGALGGLAGLLGGIRSWRKKSTETVTQLSTATDAIQKTINEKTDALQTQVSSALTKLDEKQEAGEKLMSNVSAEVLEFKKTSEETIAKLAAENAKLQGVVTGLNREITETKEQSLTIMNTQKKTMEAIVMGLCNIPDLVKNGYAAKIAAIANGQEVKEASAT